VDGCLLLVLVSWFVAGWLYAPVVSRAPDLLAVDLLDYPVPQFPPHCWLVVG